ncbi:hypothetical protein BN165_1040052 [Clostridioides difficile E1]|nr:hypothetical protein BN163_1130052 [Clostridioides difficile T5]CCK94183.1 hypothetical protein BN165_1040052 [Clostridioides difficile E1]
MPADLQLPYVLFQCKEDKTGRVPGDREETETVFRCQGTGTGSGI